MRLLHFAFIGMLLFSGCSSLPVKKSRLLDKEKEVATMRAERDAAEQKYIDAENAKKEEIVKSENNRISTGGAQAIAALGTLNADPNKDTNKYTGAAIAALEVTELALLDKVETKDLIEAIHIQKKLISEQAEEVAKGKQEIGALKDEVNIAKGNELKLKEDIQKINNEKQEALAKKDTEINEKQTQVIKLQNEITSKNEADAEAWRKENTFWNRINPFHDLGKGLGKLFGWIAIFVILGLILKVCSVLFPGANVLQVFVKGMGTVVGGGLKLIFGWIPNVLNGLHAVDKKDYDKEKKIADNAVGAVQELKYENPEVYNSVLKAKLLDWFKDTPGLEAEVEKKLKELNLK